MVPTSASRASRRLASKISSISSSSSAMSSAMSCRVAGVAVGPSSSSPMRRRVRGERSSWEALASKDFCDASRVSCDFTRFSTRSAAWLKPRAKKATSSWPCSGTRVDRSPSPHFCTLFCSSSSRRVSLRMMGYVASATAMPTRPSIQKNPKGGRLQKEAAGRGRCMKTVRPSFMRTSNSGPAQLPLLLPLPCMWYGGGILGGAGASLGSSSGSGSSTGRLAACWLGGRRTRAPWPITWPASLRMTASRSGGSAACRQAQPSKRVNTATARITASQMRRYSFLKNMAQSCWRANT